MTKQQEEQIRSLRMQGVGYKAIATVTNLSRDKVRYYCKTHNLAGYEAAVKANIVRMTEDKTVCSYCGKPLIRKNTGRPKRFCCDECREKWWKENRDMMVHHKEAIYQFECTGCGKKFSAYGNRNRKYCCHECYIHHRFWNFENASV